MDGCWGDFTINGVCVKCGIPNTQQVKPARAEARPVPSWAAACVGGSSESPQTPREVGPCLHVVGAPWAATTDCFWILEANGQCGGNK